MGDNRPESSRRLNTGGIRPRHLVAPVASRQGDSHTRSMQGHAQDVKMESRSSIVLTSRRTASSLHISNFLRIKKAG